MRMAGRASPAGLLSSETGRGGAKTPGSTLPSPFVSRRRPAGSMVEAGVRSLLVQTYPKKGRLSSVASPAKLRRLLREMRADLLNSIVLASPRSTSLLENRQK